MNTPTIDMIRTGQQIAKLRAAAGLTVRDLQQTLNLATPNAIYKWQNGITMPTIDNLVVLADIFGVRIDDIIVTNYSEKLKKSA